jgi:hypothetical protein
MFNNYDENWIYQEEYFTEEDEAEKICATLNEGNSFGTYSVITLKQYKSIEDEINAN